MKICIDPGHGGHDPGAIGPTGLEEKYVAMSISREIYDLLCFDLDNYSPFFTRCEDVFVSLQGRCDRANHENADLFVSVHCNAFSDPMAKGFEVWTSVGWTPADKYASEVFRAIREDFQFKKGRVDMSDGDEDKEAQFKVLKGTAMPAILVEVSFISNPYEEAEMKNGIWRRKMAKSIYKGICRGR